MWLNQVSSKCKFRVCHCNKAIIVLQNTFNVNLCFYLFIVGKYLWDLFYCYLFRIHVNDDNFGVKLRIIGGSSIGTKG